MAPHLDSRTATDVKLDTISLAVQTGNGIPHDEYNIRGIAHACTNRKDDIFMQRRLLQNFTFILELFIDKAHTVLDIFPACCLVRFVAFFLLCHLFSKKNCSDQKTYLAKVDIRLLI